MSWPSWAGRTAVVIATGPSLYREQLDAIRRADVCTIAINDAGIADRWPCSAPWADVLYFADIEWARFYRPKFEGLRVGTNGADGPLCVREGLADLAVTMEYGAPKFWSDRAVHGGHAGYQALQLAIGWGAKRVVLVGYDCKAAGARTNFFGTKDPAVHKDSPYSKWVEGYRTLAAHIPAGVEVLNATPGSAIDAFERTTLEAALCSA